MTLLEGLTQSAIASGLRGSALLYPLVNAAHILGLALLLGAIATLDLRLLGAFRAAPLPALARPLTRVAGAGLALALVTGALLFSTRPAAYLGNPAFLLKLGLIALALLNLLVVHRGAPWRRALAGAEPAPALRLGAAASLLLWLGALLAGRWIAFIE